MLILKVSQFRKDILLFQFSQKTNEEFLPQLAREEI